jgi:hypothetical protein
MGRACRERADRRMNANNSEVGRPDNVTAEGAPTKETGAAVISRTGELGVMTSSPAESSGRVPEDEVVSALRLR